MSIGWLLTKSASILVEHKENRIIHQDFINIILEDSNK